MFPISIIQWIGFRENLQETKDAPIIFGSFPAKFPFNSPLNHTPWHHFRPMTPDPKDLVPVFERLVALGMAPPKAATDEENEMLIFEVEQQKSHITIG